MPTLPTLPTFIHLVGEQPTIPAQPKDGRDVYEKQDTLAALSAFDVSGSDLVFVGGEGSQDFILLALRDLGEV